MSKTFSNYIMHYGMPKRSGRYPWGSGETPYQHSGDFLSRVEQYRKDGFTYTDPKDGKTYKGDAAIAKAMGMSSTEYRTALALAGHERRQLLYDRAKSLKEDGLSDAEITRAMGLKNESSLRSLMDEKSAARMNEARNTAEMLKKQIDEKGMIDVGENVERHLGISKEKFREAQYILELEGYVPLGGRVEQQTNPGKFTTIAVLAPPGTEKKELYNYENIHQLDQVVSHDNGETFDPVWVYPKSMDSKRLKINYAEDGGNEKDGLIEIRRGVEDLDLGNSHYAQVRILVDDTHYLKGMAVYSDNLPDGVDVVFNTNKSKDVPALGPKDNTVLKTIKKDDPDNPFGSNIKEGIKKWDEPDSKGGQSYYIDKNGKKQLSLINKPREEGDWSEWQDRLPAQFLAKQNKELIRKQLKIAEDDKDSELKEIMSLTNPTVKKSLLLTYADECDSAAEHLSAAALPRQKYQVILPMKTLKDNEVYAPNYEPGETVALVRYPHGGTFEIPILKVNNKNKEGREMIGNTPKDAIGINSKVAARLSGADFDGDTVMVIPCNSPRTKTRITSTQPLKGLEGFDPGMEYGGKKEGTYKRMKRTDLEMGKISNLITDMTLAGATDEEKARAVIHSMVVIDAEKHGYDYQQSFKDNGIAELKKKYQGSSNAGASTLISQAKKEVRIGKRKGSPTINPETGELEYKKANEEYHTYRDKSRKKDVTAYERDGSWYYKDKNKNEVKIEDTSKIKTHERTEKVSKMSITKNARDLSTGTVQEDLYADYANHMKANANIARKEYLATGRLKYDATAKKTYAAEVASLNTKLNDSLKNSPLERQAQYATTAKVNAIKRDNPDISKKDLGKIKQRTLKTEREKYGAKRKKFEITDKEWEAIQAGAVSDNTLSKIVKVVGADTLKSRAMPRSSTKISAANKNRIKTLSNYGYTQTEIAERLGISVSVVNDNL